MSEPGSNRWLHAEIRRVPLPAGLLARLRRIARVSDERFDAELRNVPVPDGLIAGLRGIVDDDRIDQSLMNVPAPDSLLSELRQIPENERLDEALCDVPVPAENLRLWRRIPLPSRRRERVWYWATAASLFLTVGISYALTMFGIIAVAYQDHEEFAPRLIVRQETVELVAVSPNVRILPTAPPEEPAADDPLFPNPEVQFLELVAAVAPDSRMFDRLLQPFDHHGPMTDMNLERMAPFGAPHRADDALPMLLTVADPQPRGIEPPLTRGYDRPFLFKHGDHPVVSPVLDPRLRNSFVPLSTDTGSFDRAERSLTQGRSPAPQDIFVEDFLAAMNYGFQPPERGGVAIRTAAGPSVFGGRAARMLQVGVATGATAARELPATNLTIVVDVSASMRWDGRLEKTRVALRQLVEHLDAEDRLSLVSFSEDPYVHVENVSREDADLWIDTVDSLRPEGATNLGDGLRVGGAVALRTSPNTGRARRMILITDGVPGLPENTMKRIEKILRDDIASHGVALDVIDLSDTEGGDPALGRFARAGGGQVVQIESGQRLRWTLVETLMGSPSLVAADAVLQVTFNPETVAAYRLLGHAPAAAGMMPVAVETNLHSRQTATALFEIWLKGGAGDDVATAEVTWRDPKTGEKKVRRQRISRLQFAPSFAESPLSLQAAVMAAETAEVLRQSYFAPKRSRSLQDVLVLADEVNPRLARRRSFQRLRLLAERAERARVHRGGISSD